MIKVKLSPKPQDTDKISKVVIEDSHGRVLLLLRQKGQPFAGKWDLPGGHLVVGEDWEDGARREVKEETNLSLGSLKLIQDLGRKRYFKCKEWTGQIFKNEDLPEHDEWNWYNPDELDRIDISKIYLDAIEASLKH